MEKITKGLSLLAERDSCRRQNLPFPYHRIDENGIWLSFGEWKESGKSGAAFVAAHDVGSAALGAHEA